MKSKFDDLVDHKRIVAIDATQVPAPPGSDYPGEHLLVNCHYAADHATRLPHEVLDEARADALQIVSRLASTANIHDYVSVVVTVYGHFPVAGAERPARRRLYRVNLLSKDLPNSGVSVTAEFLSQVQAVESSELDEVAGLLHATAT